MAKLSSGEKTCGCITPCVDYKYTMDISRSSTTWILQEKYPSRMKFWRVLARVLVYVQTKKRIVYTTNPKYETQDVLSNLGGQLGLWLGISLCFIFERIVQLLKDIFVKFWKGKRSLKVSPDPSSGSSKNVFVVQQTDVVL
ncbi:degenerin-like protein asic-2 [Tachypleus tridentatus]|uniref:degenerin-like protein asic-2 n=1 Tax=Tachypleus tridentatus TaxID=6853 RepID=UPI003FD1ADDE